jgi:hypothetical protein
MFGIVKLWKRNCLFKELVLMEVVHFAKNVEMDGEEKIQYVSYVILVTDFITEN